MASRCFPEFGCCPILPMPFGLIGEDPENLKFVNCRTRLPRTTSKFPDLVFKISAVTSMFTANRLPSLIHDFSVSLLDGCMDMDGLMHATPVGE